MKTSLRIKRTVASILTAAILLTLLPAAFAIGSSFFKNHTDWHFDLSKSPDTPMTVEEFIALSTAYSYWSTGVSGGTTPTDKNGKLPSAWAAPYIRAEFQKGTITPNEIDYSANVTLAFAMEFFTRAKGLYSYNAVNLRSFSGTEGLTPDQLLYLCTAVDYGIFAYSKDMNVSVTIPRKDLENKYLIPTGDYRARTPEIIKNAGNFKYSATFWDVNAGPEDVNERDFQKKQLEVLKNNLDNFNVLIMDLISLTDGGSGNYLYDRFGKFSEHDQALTLCQNNGIKVLGSVFNYYDAAVLDRMKSSDAVIAEVAKQMAAAMDKHGLDGLNIEIEMSASTGTTYRETYSKLLKTLAPMVHEKGKMLSVTVGAYMQGKDEKNSMYDYSVIADTADMVNIINYDDHPAKAYTNGGAMGAVSNYTYVQRCLRYAAMCMGAEKVNLSYGTFGVDYNTTDHTAQNISHDAVTALISRYNASVKTSGAAVDDAYFSYTDGGKAHTVYFESDSGIENRIDLAKRYGLGGVTCWLMGWKNQNAFDKMGEGIHALPFVDVAESSVYCDAVAWAYKHTPQQITGGFDATHFVPNNPCTRAQVVTFLWRAKNCPEPKSSTNPFGDVSAKQANGKDNPYYKAILWAAEEGITTGYDGGIFKPNATVTRAQFVTFLWRADGMPATSGSINGFVDAGQIASPYQQAVAWAVEKGITTGYEDKTFRPKAACTRWAVVLFMYRDMA